MYNGCNTCRRLQVICAQDSDTRCGGGDIVYNTLGYLFGNQDKLLELSGWSPNDAKLSQSKDFVVWYASKLLGGWKL